MNIRTALLAPVLLASTRCASLPLQAGYTGAAARRVLLAALAAALALPGLAQPAPGASPRHPVGQAMSAGAGQTRRPPEPYRAYPAKEAAAAQASSPSAARPVRALTWLASLLKPGLTLLLLTAAPQGAVGQVPGPDPGEPAQAPEASQSAAPSTLTGCDDGTGPVTWRLEPAVLGKPMDLARFEVDLKGLAELPPGPGGLLPTLELDLRAVNRLEARGTLRYHDPDEDLAFTGRVRLARIHEQDLDGQEGVRLDCLALSQDPDGGSFLVELQCAFRGPPPPPWTAPWSTCAWTPVRRPWGPGRPMPAAGSW